MSVRAAVAASVVAAFAVLVLAGPASAATPAPGAWEGRGSLGRVSFDVENKRLVRALLPVRCAPGEKPGPLETINRTFFPRIDRAGRFRLTAGKLAMSGRFSAKGKVSGLYRFRTPNGSCDSGRVTFRASRVARPAVPATGTFSGTDADGAAFTIEVGDTSPSRVRQPLRRFVTAYASEGRVPCEGGSIRSFGGPQSEGGAEAIDRADGTFESVSDLGGLGSYTVRGRFAADGRTVEGTWSAVLREDGASCVRRDVPFTATLR